LQIRNTVNVSAFSVWDVKEQEIKQAPGRDNPQRQHRNISFVIMF